MGVILAKPACSTLILCCEQAGSNAVLRCVYTAALPKLRPLPQGDHAAVPSGGSSQEASSRGDRERQQADCRPPAAPEQAVATQQLPAGQGQQRASVHEKSPVSPGKLLRSQDSQPAQPRRHSDSGAVAAEKLQAPPSPLPQLPHLQVLFPWSVHDLPIGLPY
jgi:hypothetical protein